MSIVLEHRVDIIPHPFVVACEGYGDVKFIASLLTQANIANCNVGCPSTKGGFGNGKDALPQYLQAIASSNRIGKASLRGILVVLDTDRDAAGNFDLAAAALESAEFKKPSRPFQVEGEPIRSGVFLMPGQGRTGALEHILWEAAVRHNPRVKDCVEEYATCMGNALANTTENQEAKMRMSALVAVTCKDNPWTSAALIWKDPGNPVPINSPCFETVTDFLRSFVEDAGE